MSHIEELKSSIIPKSTTIGFTNDNNDYTSRTRNVEIDPLELSSSSTKSGILTHSQSSRRFGKGKLGHKVRFDDDKGGFKSDRPAVMDFKIAKSPENRKKSLPAVAK